MSIAESIADTSLPAVAALPAPRAQVALAVATGASVTDAARKAGVHRSTVYDWIRSDPAFSAAVDEARQDYIGLLRDQLRSLSVKALNRLEALLDDPATPAAVALRAALAVLNRPRFPDQGWTLPEMLNTPQEESCLENLALLEADYKALCQRERLKRASAEPRSPDTIRHNPTEFSVSGFAPDDETPELPDAPGPEFGSHLLVPLETSTAAPDRLHRPIAPGAPPASADKSRHNPTQIAVLSPPLAGDPVPASLSASASLREPISGRPSRNAPCPCGSGKKYKGCCGADHRARQGRRFPGSGRVPNAVGLKTLAGR